MDTFAHHAAIPGPLRGEHNAQTNGSHQKGTQTLRSSMGWQHSKGLDGESPCVARTFDPLAGSGQFVVATNQTHER